MGPEHPDRFARLNEQCLVVLQLAQRADDRVKRLPVSRGASGPTVNNESVRILRHVGIEIVHEHAKRGFLVPAFATLLSAARRANHASITHRQKLLRGLLSPRGRYRTTSND